MNVWVTAWAGQLNGFWISTRFIDRFCFCLCGPIRLEGPIAPRTQVSGHFAQQLKLSTTNSLVLIIILGCFCLCGPNRLEGPIAPRSHSSRQFKSVNPQFSHVITLKSRLQSPLRRKNLRRRVRFRNRLFRRATRSPTANWITCPTDWKATSRTINICCRNPAGGSKKSSRLATHQVSARTKKNFTAVVHCCGDWQARVAQRFLKGIEIQKGVRLRFLMRRR